VRRVALDCLPPLRRNLLAQLCELSEPASTTELALAVDVPTVTTKRTLEDLAAYRLVTRMSQGKGKADLWPSQRVDAGAPVMTTTRNIPPNTGRGTNRQPYIAGAGPVEPAFLSVAETAQLLGCSEKVVRAELKRGRLPEYRVGRLVRIRVSDLERLRG
jgi:excisionase family DNA binding protein